MAESMEDIIVRFLIDRIKKSKAKCMGLEELQKYLREKLGDKYTSSLGIAVKQKLINHSELDFFKEGTYIDDSKYYHCVGNWLAIKNTYKNPIEAKRKMGLDSWMTSKDDDSYLDK